MAAFTFGKRPSITPNDIDNKFNNSQKNYGKISKICEDMKSLVSEQIIPPKFLDIIGLDRKVYREFLERRNNYLKNHQVMDAKEFTELFGNKNLQSKKIENNEKLVSGKYNKSDINQGKLCLCVFDTFLTQLKETPLFETLIRCSLQRNENNNGWKCLIPFCNNEGKYIEVSDKEIKYLKSKKNKIGKKKLISKSSLGFNILETILIKIYGLKGGNTDGQLQGLRRDGGEIKQYDNFMLLKKEDLHYNLPGVLVHGCFERFLGGNKTIIDQVDLLNDNEIESLIELSKLGTLKLFLSGNKFSISSDKKFIEVNKGKFKGLKYKNITKKKNINKGANIKTINERGYSIDLVHEAGPNEEISIGISPQLGNCFMIKGTKERFVPGHQYSIEGIHKKNNETFVTIINPRYTGKKIDIPLKYMGLFGNIKIIGLDINEFFVENEGKK